MNQHNNLPSQTFVPLPIDPEAFACPLCVINRQNKMDAYQNGTCRNCQKMTQLSSYTYCYTCSLTLRSCYFCGQSVLDGNSYLPHIEKMLDEAMKNLKEWRGAHPQMITDATNFFNHRRTLAQTYRNKSADEMFKIMVSDRRNELEKMQQQTQQYAKQHSQQPGSLQGSHQQVPPQLSTPSAPSHLPPQLSTPSAPSHLPPHLPPQLPTPSAPPQSPSQLPTPSAPPQSRPPLVPVRPPPPIPAGPYQNYSNQNYSNQNHPNYQNHANYQNHPNYQNYSNYPNQQNQHNQRNPHGHHHGHHNGRHGHQGHQTH